MNFDYNLSLGYAGGVKRVMGLIQDFNLSRTQETRTMEVMGGQRIVIPVSSPETSVSLTILIKHFPSATSEPESRIIELPNHEFIVDFFIKSTEIKMPRSERARLELDLIYFQSYKSLLEAEVYCVTEELTA